jgi:hypothetical protein
LKVFISEWLPNKNLPAVAALQWRHRGALAGAAMQSPRAGFTLCRMTRP